jgi:hypothetical protein
MDPEVPRLLINIPNDQAKSKVQKEQALVILLQAWHRERSINPEITMTDFYDKYSEDSLPQYSSVTKLFDTLDAIYARSIFRQRFPSLPSTLAIWKEVCKFIKKRTPDTRLCFNLQPEGASVLPSEVALHLERVIVEAIHIQTRDGKKMIHIDHWKQALRSCGTHANLHNH